MWGGGGRWKLFGVVVANKPSEGLLHVQCNTGYITVQEGEKDNACASLLTPTLARFPLYVLQHLVQMRVIPEVESVTAASGEEFEGMTANFGAEKDVACAFDPRGEYGLRQSSHRAAPDIAPSPDVG